MVLLSICKLAILKSTTIAGSNKNLRIARVNRTFQARLFDPVLIVLLKSDTNKRLTMLNNGVKLWVRNQAFYK
jgi:hypothetical protein